MADGASSRTSLSRLNIVIKKKVFVLVLVEDLGVAACDLTSIFGGEDVFIKSFY